MRQVLISGEGDGQKETTKVLNEAAINGKTDRRMRRASSKGEVLEVSSDAKDVEREDLRIRHTVCSPSAPEKWAEEESQRNLVLAHNSLWSVSG